MVIMKNILNEKILRVAMNNAPPYLILSNVSGVIKPVDGTEYYYWETMSRILNFSYEIIESNIKFGEQLPNLEWDGLLGLLSRDEIDVAISGLSIDEQRMRVVDFLHPYITCPVVFVMRAPTFLDNSMILLETLKNKSFIGVILSFLVVSIFAELFKVNNYFFNTLCPLLYQGFSSRIPKRPSLYFLLTSWMFLCFILTTIYSSELSSKMTIPVITPLIKTFDELIVEQKSGRVRIYIRKDSIFVKRIKSIKCELCARIAENVIELDGNGLSSRLRVLQKSETPGALISDVDSILMGITYDPLAFYVAMDESANFFNDHVALAVHKNSPFKHIFNDLTSKFKTNGLFIFWRKKIFNKFGRNSSLINNFKSEEFLEKNGVLKFESGLRHFEIYFKILLLGQFISLFKFLFELLIVN